MRDVLVGATLVASICNSRLKSLLHPVREISTVGRNDTTSYYRSPRLCASAVNHELRCRRAVISYELAAHAPAIQMSNAG